MSTTEIPPNCPFCGKEAGRYYDSEGHLVAARCFPCCVPFIPIDKWNTRASDQRADRLAEALRAILECDCKDTQEEARAALASQSGGEECPGCMRELSEGEQVYCCEVCKEDCCTACSETTDKHEVICWGCHDGESSGGEKSGPSVDPGECPTSCAKAPHIGAGHLHAEDDDRPYFVDGVRYCGRCHCYLPYQDITSAMEDRA